MISRWKTTASMLAWALVLLLAYTALAQAPAGTTKSGRPSTTEDTEDTEVARRRLLRVLGVLRGEDGFAPMDA